MTGGQASSPELIAYRDQVTKTILETWRKAEKSQPPKARARSGYGVRVNFEVATDGTIINPRALSGDPANGHVQAALRAVREARLPPLPPEVRSLLETHHQSALQVTVGFADL